LNILSLAAAVVAEAVVAVVLVDSELLPGLLLRWEQH
jgi:hypothetical protein